MELVRPVLGRLRRAAQAHGAGDSGLSALLSVHALHAAGDAMVAVALAGSLFFSVPIGQARGRLALYLLLTLLPFSFLIPVAGPLLDRLRHGRRVVLAVATGGRGLLTWVMAGATGSLLLYPLALAVLVLSRAYGVARSAAVPRVRPDGMALVQANARLNVAAVGSSSLAALVGAGIGAGLGSRWVLYAASLLLLAGAVLALRLPGSVDEPSPDRRSRAVRFRIRDVGRDVLGPLGGAVALRGVGGLLTIFLAFVLRAHGASAYAVGAIVGAAAAGQLVGTLVAARVRRLSGAALARLSPVVGLVACVAATTHPRGVLPAVAAGVLGLVSSTSKFALDSALQTHVATVAVSRAFARSETALQAAWALGAAIGLLLPADRGWGFAVAALLCATGAVLARG